MTTLKPQSAAADPHAGGSVPGQGAGPDDAAAELRAVMLTLATVTYAMDGTILAANERFLHLFGYLAREVIGLPRTIFLSGDEATRSQDAAIWAAIERGESQVGEFRRLRKGGMEVWVEATYAPVIAKSGQVYKVIQYVHDVTARKLRAADDRGQIVAIDASQAVIHCKLDGTIIETNDRFLDALGYRREEVLGRHHRMFVEPAYAESQDYAAFWANLARGLPQAGEYKRIGQDGREVWLQATYNPIFDLKGQPFKIVTFATEVTRERMRQADHQGQIAAIRKSLGVIEFNMDGTIVDANESFLDAMGYRLDEIEGRHHRMFVDPAYSHGSDYATFWGNLAKGMHQAAEFKRIGKNGQDVWLQATYNPVCDLNGRPFKVVKYATVVTREKLRQADHQGQIAAIHKALCVISFDLDGAILDANDNFLSITGYRLAEVRGRHHRMFVEPFEAESPRYRGFWDDLAKGRHQAAEYKRLGKDGREIWLQATYNPIFDINGRPFKVVKFATDVTREKMRQADHEGQISAIHKSQCVIAFDMAGRILDANQNFLTAMGYTLADIKGSHHSIFVEPGHADTADYAAFWETLRAGAFHAAIYKRIGKDGRQLWIQASYNPILDLNGRPFKVIKIATDITSEVALSEALSHARQQAQHDAATALPNRVRLASFMASALVEPSARVAILYLDLDRFKPINDQFGHHAGDRVLGEIADRLRRALPEDQIVARVGGDEFVVAAPNLSDAEIEVLCQRLIAIVTLPIRHEDHEVQVGLSIGVAVSPSDADTPDELLRCADVALYRSKANGRGTYSFFASQINERIVAQRHLTEDMRRGLVAGEFYLEYQPRFHARKRTVQSVEALVRWAHPEHGRINPVDFIPLAEKSGLIVPLGAWVLRTACHAAMAWPGIGVSVNVSPVQFRSGELTRVVDAVLSETRLPAQRLELEITEGVLLEDADRANLLLGSLKALGVRLAMDDFGTGYSSLSYLRTFPFDVIKIDQRFIADMETREGGRSVVQAILGLGKALNMSVTAEGVETPGQLLLLTLDECEEVQGFLLARPMSASAITELLAQERDQPLAAAC